jgi:hypothetical protein
MSGPKHQHFIPRSYLQNFASKKDDKFFVEAKLKTAENPEKELLSTKDICVGKNLYTLPNVEGDEKYKLEKYYAKEIDEVYPDVYRILVDPNSIFISKEEREKIVMTTMSLFFRTPKFLNDRNDHLNGMMNYVIKNHQDSPGNVKFQFDEYNLNFHINDFEEVKKELKVQNKIKFINEHLKDWHDFVEFKINSGIAVFQTYQTLELITSDNPVAMHSVKGNSLDPFDPSNMINLPLDAHHYLTIFPNTVPSVTDRIFRGKRDDWFVHSLNLDVEKNSENWILGKPNSIYAHIKDKIKFNERSEENLQAVATKIEKVNDSKELDDILQSVGTIAHQKVADKVSELLKKAIYKDDPDMEQMVLNLEKHGFKVEKPKWQ